MHVRARPPPGKDDAVQQGRAVVTPFVPPWMSAMKERSPAWTS